jgi:hypothetical protein
MRKICGKPYDPASVQEVFRGIVGVAPLEQVSLLADARAMLRRLEQIADNDVWEMWDSIASIDAPDFNEEKVKEQNLNFDQLEIALYHRSHWVVRLALFLFLNAADAPLMKAAATRLLADGKDDSLWAAAYMAEQLEAEAAVALACNRLKMALVSGCEHVFNLLRRLKPPLDENLAAAIENGLMTGDEDTAVAAATFAEEIALPGAVLMTPIVVRG